MSSDSATIQSLAAAERYLEGLINLERRSDWPYTRLGLGPIRALLARLGHPERRLRVIHIAGSKGKGSTALLVEALLGASGAKVGTFSSPHLESFVERFRIGGREVEGSELARAVQALRPHVDALRVSQPQDAPTFFDVLCAAGIWLFAEAAVDWCVLEVGIGGRLDSTNAVVPTLCCITSIELEHTEILGDTLAEIAREKAGILKAGVPAVLGPLPPDAESVIRARAQSLGADLTQLGRDFRVDVGARDAEGMEVTLRAGVDSIEFRLPLFGDHHAVNAALAAILVRDALGLAPAALRDLCRRGFQNAALPGRVEILSRDPWVVVDAAHTAASARALADSLRRLPLAAGGVHFVLSVSAGKELDALLRAWLPLARRFTLTRALAARSLEPAALSAAIHRLAPNATLEIVPDPNTALRRAWETRAEGEALCAAGSFFLAGIARRVWLAERP